MKNSKKVVPATKVRKTFGHTYSLTAKGKKSLPELGKQAKAILTFVGKKSRNLSDLTIAFAKSGLTKSKAPSTIVAWYLSRAKREGLVQFSK